LKNGIKQSDQPQVNEQDQDEEIDNIEQNEENNVEVGYNDYSNEVNALVNKHDLKKRKMTKKLH
jgi:hypothetical protein